jgi:splicing factor 3A subunit 3
MQQKSNQLMSIYNDSTGARQKEIDELRIGQDLGEFYKKLKSIKEAHKSDPMAPAQQVEVTMNKSEKQRFAQDIEAKFSGEENFGKNLDINDLYQIFVNLKGIDKMDYGTYVEKFDELDKLPSSVKTAAYKEFVTSRSD